MEQFTPPMYIFFGNVSESDVVIGSLDGVYQINEAACEYPARPNNLSKEIEFANKGLQLHLCASAPVTPFGHLVHYFLGFVWWD